MFYPVAAIEDMAGMFIGAIFFMIPIVAILTKHQQRMAEIIHSQNRSEIGSQELQQLRDEVRDLRQLVLRQVIQADEASARMSSTPPVFAEDSVSNRLGNLS